MTTKQNFILQWFFIEGVVQFLCVLFIHRYCITSIWNWNSEKSHQQWASALHKNLMVWIMELGELNINVTASYTKGRCTESANACIFACFILSFTVLLLNDELSYCIVSFVQCKFVLAWWGDSRLDNCIVFSLSPCQETAFAVTWWINWNWLIDWLTTKFMLHCSASYILFRFPLTSEKN